MTIRVTKTADTDRQRHFVGDFGYRYLYRHGVVKKKNSMGQFLRKIADKHCYISFHHLAPLSMIFSKQF